MISFHGVNKSFSTPDDDIVILDNTSITIQAGDFIAIMGPSGTGKTTILNMIAGLEQPTQGQVISNNTDMSSLSTDQKTRFRGKNISFVFQQFHLLPQLTVTENIDLVIELNNLTRRFGTDEILEKVGLGGRGNAYPSILSGGEQQRVALARAFVGKTPILLADEPTGNLDQKTAIKVMDLMQSLHNEVNNTIVMITHDHTVADYANSVYTLHKATLIQ